MPNPNDICFVEHRLMNNYAKYQQNPLIALWQVNVWNNTIKKSQKTSKRGHNSNIGKHIYTKICRQIDLNMLNTFILYQIFDKPNCFKDICKKQLFDPYVLFLVTTAMFFVGSKIRTTVMLSIG